MANSRLGLGTFNLLHDENREKNLRDMHNRAAKVGLSDIPGIILSELYQAQVHVRATAEHQKMRYALTMAARPVLISKSFEYNAHPDMFDDDGDTIMQDSDEEDILYDSNGGQSRSKSKNKN